MNNTNLASQTTFQKLTSPGRLFLLAVVLGIITGLFPHPYAITAAENLGTIFVSLLKLISVPIIFLAIVSTITSLRDKATIRFLGGKTLKYTLLTTIIAATVALGLFLLIEPVAVQNYTSVAGDNPYESVSYWEFVLSNVPANIVTPFSEGNVIAILFLALLISFAILSLPAEQKAFLNNWFTSLFAAMLAITRLVLRFLPIAIWAFITQFIIEIQADHGELTDLALYLVCVVAANLIQAFVVLPLMLKYKGISPLQVAKAALPALNLAFWSKSSSATLPATMNVAQQRLNIRPTVAGFTLPLCTAINMNACAAFILITVLFVSMSSGVAFSPVELIAWIAIATLAAIGNAGVPMGCYFLTIALLTTMNVPINLMFVILPAYLLLDMLETSINVWSDLCVAKVVDNEISDNQLKGEAS
jgi:Na+/H+-dicarboxylate symporter